MISVALANIHSTRVHSLISRYLGLVYFGRIDGTRSCRQGRHRGFRAECPELLECLRCRALTNSDYYLRPGSDRHIAWRTNDHFLRRGRQGFCCVHCSNDLNSATPLSDAERCC